MDSHWWIGLWDLWDAQLDDMCTSSQKYKPSPPHPSEQPICENMCIRICKYFNWQVKIKLT